MVRKENVRSRSQANGCQHRHNWGPEKEPPKMEQNKDFKIKMKKTLKK